MTWTSLDDGLNQNPLTRPNDMDDATFALWVRMSIQTASLMRYDAFDGTLSPEDARQCTSTPRTFRRRLNDLAERGIITVTPEGRYKVNEAPTLLTFHGGAALSAKRAAAGAKGGKKSGETRRKQSQTKTEATTQANSEPKPEANASGHSEANTEATASEPRPLAEPAPPSSMREIDALMHDDPFRLAWMQYPRHDGSKKRARELWDEITGGESHEHYNATGADLLAAVTTYAIATREDGSGQWVPAMDKWLGNDKYLETLPSLKTAPTKRKARWRTADGTLIDDAWIDRHIRSQAPPNTLSDSMVSTFWASVKTGHDPLAAAKEILEQCNTTAERRRA